LDKIAIVETVARFSDAMQHVHGDGTDGTSLTTSSLIR
jgi:hypothetical protein